MVENARKKVVIGEEKRLKREVKKAKKEADDAEGKVARLETSATSAKRKAREAMAKAREAAKERAWKVKKLRSFGLDDVSDFLAPGHFTLEPLTMYN